ncbi:MAG: isoleucine--tRNA ligase [Candidatus Bathyarchaeia archaeon]
MSVKSNFKIAKLNFGDLSLNGCDGMHVGLLPKTYDPKKIEYEVFRWWSENKIYEKVKKLSEQGEKFYFLDGPPYVTSSIHLGTAWNKIIKDSILRYRRMRGFKVRDRPGFDMHGLPIEVMVERLLNIGNKREIENRIGIDRFVEECENFALKNLKVLTEQFKNLGVWMDWDNPYMTIRDEYIEAVWLVVKKAEELGLLENVLRVTHWCPRCETALAAGYEVSQEYRDVEDPSIYVKFPIEGRDREYLLIWTTTPWTLPANVAIMAHPNYVYVRVKVGREVYILAKERVKPVFDEVGVEFEVIEEFDGKSLQGLKYKPPLADEVSLQKELKKAHIVVLSEEFVRLTEGTGLVHSAPGHGEEDFEVGLRYGLPVFSPVDQSGRFTSEAGKYAGMYIKEADKVIVEDLQRKGLLLYSGTIIHRYPHCWRCKTPLLLRATKQWIIRMSKLRDLLLEENEKVKWIPEWAGKSRFGNWLMEISDWVISRQRYWGVPLPIWICEKCGKRRVVGSKRELLEACGVEELRLHRPWVDQLVLKCDCGGNMRRVLDVIDVWMDSGSASWASLGYPSDDREFKEWFPVDFIVEGHDQTRGWFYSLLACSSLVFNSVPYKCVAMHGFVLDETGREMHKSWGNYIAPEEVIEKYGRDVLRFYELQHTLWEDLKFSWKGVGETFSFMNILWNVYVFASTYMNLDKFNPSKWSLERVKDFMSPEDLWILSKTQRLIKDVTEAFENYHLHSAVKTLRDFIVEDVSRWYIRLIRRRTWVEEEAPEKLASYSVLYNVLKTFLLLSAPIIPFTCESIYQYMFRFAEPNQPESVHMCKWPQSDESWKNPELEEAMEIVKDVVEASAKIRQEVGLKLRQPLKSALLKVQDELASKLKRLTDVLKEQLNVKELVFLRAGEDEKLWVKVAEPNMSLIGREFRSKAPVVAEAIRRMSHVQIDELMNSGRCILNVGEESLEVKPEYVFIKSKLTEGFACAGLKNGMLYLDVRIDKALQAGGLSRDVVRRIQYMRKEMDLPVDAYIEVYVKVSSQETKSLLEETKEYIAGEVRAKKLTFTLGEIPRMEYSKVWNLDGEELLIGISRLSSYDKPIIE